MQLYTPNLTWAINQGQMKMKMMKLNRQNRCKFKTVQPLLGGRANSHGLQLKVD